jgi:hypothetical protein
MEATRYFHPPSLTFRQTRKARRKLPEDGLHVRGGVGVRALLFVQPRHSIAVNFLF